MKTKNEMYVKCSICLSDKYKVLYESTLEKDDFSSETIINDYKNTLNSHKKHGRIVKCQKCGFVYTNPIEDTAEIIKAYSMVIDEDYISMEKFRKILANNHLRTLEKYKKKGKILDVGCFVGLFLETAGERGWKIYGIEPSVWASKIAREKGIKIIGSNLEVAKIENDYDVITMWDVIEHLADPRAAVRKSYKALKKGGLLAIGTPNIDSFVSKILGSNNPYLIRMHLGFYSPETIKKLLKSEGFKILETKSYGRTYPISYFIDSVKFQNKYFLYLKRKIKKIDFISNYPLHLNLRDSFEIIAEK